MVDASPYALPVKGTSMPVLSVRRIASSALCATLLLGVTAPAALADDTARDRTHEAAPLPNAEALRGQVKQLNDLSAMTTQVTALVDAAAQADNGQLSATEATRLGDAAKAAITRCASTMASTTSTTPATPVAPNAPTASTNPAAVPPSLAAGPARADAKVPADAVGDALTALQDALKKVLDAVTSGDPTSVLPAATEAVGALGGAVLAILGQLNLPLPSLPVPLPS